MGPVKTDTMDALYAERRRAYEIYAGSYVPPQPIPSGMAPGAIPFAIYSSGAPRALKEEVQVVVSRSGKDVPTLAAKRHQEERRAVTLLMNDAVLWELEIGLRRQQGGEVVPTELGRRYQAAEQYLDKKLGRISPSRLDALAQLAKAKTVEDLADAIHLLNQCHLPNIVAQTAAALWLVGDPDEPNDTGILRWLKAETQLPLPLGVGRITPGAAALAEVLFPERDLHIPDFVSGWMSPDPRSWEYADQRLRTFVHHHRRHLSAVLSRSGHDVDSNTIALFELNLAASMAGMAAAAWAMGSASTLANAASVARTGKYVSELSLPARFGIASAELALVDVPVFTAVSSAMTLPATGIPTLRELWAECRSALWVFGGLRLVGLGSRFLYGFRSLPPRLESVTRAFEARVLRVTGREFRPDQELIGYHGSTAGLLAEATSYMGAVTVLSGERILKTPQMEGGLGASDSLEIFGEQALHLAILMFGGRGIHFNAFPGHSLLTRAVERHAERLAPALVMEAASGPAPDAPPPVEPQLSHVSPRRIVDPLPTVAERISPIGSTVQIGTDLASGIRQEWRDAEGKTGDHVTIGIFIKQAGQFVSSFRKFTHDHMETLLNLQAATTGKDHRHVTRVLGKVTRWRDQITGLLTDLQSSVIQLPATDHLLAEWWDVLSEFHQIHGDMEQAVQAGTKSAQALIRGAEILTLRHRYRAAVGDYLEAAKAQFGLGLWREGLKTIATSALVLKRSAPHREVVDHFFKAAADLAATADAFEPLPERVWACVTVAQLRLRGLQWAVENHQFLKPEDGYSVLQFKDPLADVLRLVQEDPKSFSADDFKDIIAVLEGGTDRLWMTGDWDARDQGALRLSEVNDEILTFMKDLRKIVGQRMKGSSQYDWSDLFTAMSSVIDRFEQRGTALNQQPPTPKLLWPPRAKRDITN